MLKQPLPSFPLLQLPEEENNSAALLYEANHTPTSTPAFEPPRFPPSPPTSVRDPPITNPVQAFQFTLLLLLLGSSACASHILPHAVLTNYPAVAWLSFAQFGTMSVLGHFSRKSISIAKERRWIIIFFGCVLVTSKWMEVLVARQLDIRIWSAIELLLLPVLLATSSSLSELPRPSARLSLFLTFATFLSTFCLVGLPAPVPALLLAFFKVVIEAIKVTMIVRLVNKNSFVETQLEGNGNSQICSKDGEEETGEMAGNPFVRSDKRKELYLEIFFGGCMIATAVSLILAFTISLLVTSPHVTPPFLTLLFSTIFSACSDTLYLFALSTLPTLTVLSVLLPRNALLLIFLTLGISLVGTRRTGENLSRVSNNWLQMLIALVGSSGSMCWADESWGGIGETVRELWLSVISREWHEREFTYDSLSIILREEEEPHNDLEQNVSREVLSGVNKVDRTPPTHYNNSIPFALVFLPFLPFLFFLLQIHHHPSFASFSGTTCPYLPYAIRANFCPEEVGFSPARTVDLVFAYYDENLKVFKDHLMYIKGLEFVRERDVKVFLYNKGIRDEKELREALGLTGKDEVHPLQNRGREGATYLQHILRHYNASLLATSSQSLPSISAPPLADHTFFLQPHLAWDWIARPRLQLVAPSTGFAHFGPMMRSNCGEDGRGNGFYPIVRDLYQIFEGKICPPTGQLTAWSAQFVVSKRRILKNPYERYKSTDDILEAPNGHWIHNMWGPQDSGGETAPASGHSLERAWPIIFGCSDPRPADECPDDVHIREKCQCLDY